MACEMCGVEEKTNSKKVGSVQTQVCETCANTDEHKFKQAQMEEQVRPDIAPLFKATRERLGMTEEQFAAKMDVETPAYQQFESGEQLPTLETARKLEKDFNMPLIMHVKVKRAQP